MIDIKVKNEFRDYINGFISEGDSSTVVYTICFCMVEKDFDFAKAFQYALEQVEYEKGRSKFCGYWFHDEDYCNEREVV